MKALSMVIPETGTLADVIPSGGSAYPLMARLPIEFEGLLSTNTVGDDLLGEMNELLSGLPDVKLDADFVSGLEQLVRWLRSSAVGKDRSEYDWAIERLRAINCGLAGQPQSEVRSYLLMALK